MRASVPWLGSLLLHSLFFIGLIVLPRTPAELPLRLTLDFQLLAPQQLQEVDPEPLAKPPAPVETVSAPPAAVPEIRAARPEEILKPPVVVPLKEPEPPASATPPAEPAPVQPASGSAEKTAELEQLKRQAQTVHFIRGEVLRKLKYPAIARKQGWTGSLILSFILCADGSVENLEVLQSSGHKVLDRAALNAVVANAPFSGGYPRTQVKLPITFQLD